MRFLKTKGRAISILIASIIALALFTISTRLGYIAINSWYGILLGVCLMVVALLAHLIIGRKKKIGYILSFILNVIGTGVSASSYYTMTGVECHISNLLKSAIISLVVLILVSILLTLGSKNKHIIVVIAGLIDLGLIITSIIMWVKQGGEIYAFTFFSLVFATFFIVVEAVTVDEEERSLIKDCSFGSFGIYLIVVVTVIIAIMVALGADDCDCDCDGSCCDCCDGGGSGSSKSKKIKK